MIRTNKFILTVTLVFFLSSAFSQIYFKEIATEKDDKMGKKYRLNDSILLCVRAKGDYYAISPNYIAKYKLDLTALNTRTGNLEYKTELPNCIDGQYLDRNYRVYCDTIHSRYILMGVAVSNAKNQQYVDKQKVNLYQSTAIVHLNYDYQVVFDTIIFDSIGYEHYGHEITADGNILFMTVFLSNTYDCYTKLWKTDIYGNIIKRKEYSRFETGPLLLQVPTENSYYLFSRIKQDVCSVDKNTLEIQQEVDIEVPSDPYFFITSVVYYPYQNAIMCLGSAEVQMGITHHNSYMCWDTASYKKPILNANYLELQNHYDTFTYQGKRCSKWIDNSVYLGTVTKGSDMDLNGFKPIDNSIIVQKFDIGGGVLWSRTYKAIGDGYHYITLDMYVDTQENIIVFASRFKIGGDMQRDIIYFKVDKETGNMIPWDE